MLTIPVMLNETDYILFVALQDSNIERIKRYDPAEVIPEKFGGEWHKKNLREIQICYATADDERQVTEHCKAGRYTEALRLLTRGFSFRPDMGDHDGEYGSVLNAKPSTKE